MHRVRIIVDDSKDCFFEELEQVFDHFPKCHMKILLYDFNAKAGREDLFNLTKVIRVYIRIVMTNMLE
jgi:hypothetical protein